MRSISTITPNSTLKRGGEIEMEELKVKDFESALRTLEDIVGKLETGDLTLERSLELFEEGIKISRFCGARLEEAERKVEVLTRAADGTLSEQPFPEESEN